MKAIIFDLDGTLVDSRESILSSIEFGLEQIGWAAVEFNRKKAVQFDLRTTLKTTAAEQSLSLSDDQILKFVNSYREHHSRNPEETMKLYEGVPEMLSNLRSNFSVAVATTKHTEQAKHVLARLKIADFFDHIQGTDPGLRYKPAPDILHTTMDALCLRGMPAAYVGDSAHDMTAAKAAQMIAVGATYGFSGKDHLMEGEPHHFIDHIREIENLFRVES